MGLKLCDHSDPTNFVLLTLLLNGSTCIIIQEITLIGRPDAATEQDIQLLGLGIMSQHCILLIEGADVFLEPLDGARFVIDFFRFQHLIVMKSFQHSLTLSIKMVFVLQTLPV